MKWNLDIIGFKVIGAGCWIEKDLGLSASPQIVQKMKITAIVYIYQLAEFGDLMSCGSKDILKTQRFSCTS